MQAQHASSPCSTELIQDNGNVKYGIYDLHLKFQSSTSVNVSDRHHSEQESRGGSQCESAREDTAEPEDPLLYPLTQSGHIKALPDQCTSHLTLNRMLLLASQQQEQGSR